MRLPNVKKNHKSDDGDPSKYRMPLPRRSYPLGCLIFRNRDDFIQPGPRRFYLVGCFIVRDRNDFIHIQSIVLGGALGCIASEIEFKRNGTIIKKTGRQTITSAFTLANQTWTRRLRVTA